MSCFFKPLQISFPSETTDHLVWRHHLTLVVSAIHTEIKETKETEIELITKMVSMQHLNQHRVSSSSCLDVTWSIVGISN